MLMGNSTFKKIAMLGIAFIVVPKTFAGTNLVLNPSFEEVNSSINQSLNAIENHHAADWHGKSTDLFGYNPSQPIQNPIQSHDGNFYAGFIAYHSHPAGFINAGDYREYMYGKLHQQLKNGVYYNVQAKFAHSDFENLRYSIAQVGIGFTSDYAPDLLNVGSGPSTTVKVAAKNSETTPLTETQWKSVENPNYLADGTENYVAIGLMNFVSPLDQSLIQISSTLPPPLQSLNHNGAYYFVDSVQVTCESTPSFRVNGAVADVHELPCGTGLTIDQAPSTKNIAADRWAVTALDKNLNELPGQTYYSEVIEHSPAIQNSGSVSITDRLPQIAALVSQGKNFRLTRYSNCHYPNETASYTTTIINHNYPTWVDSEPSYEKLPILAQVNHDVRFELKHGDVKPVMVNWTFDHPESQEQGFGASRSWNQPKTYNNYTTATYSDGCVMKIDFPTRIIRPTQFIPNAFTPNGDGLNDIFRPAVQDCEVTRFSIFDRWGKLVQTSSGRSAGWDGNDQAGNPAPIGTYFYQIQVLWPTDQRKDSDYTESFNGAVNLIR
jgi:gliding motility-associated-like protein